jgi:hypothetical protein
MRPLASRLSRAGYQALSVGYPSTRKTPQELVAYLHEALAACCRDGTRTHFVTHSLGGILLRAYLIEHPLPELGRVVMLAPPNRGSELVDVLGDTQLFRWLLGPTAVQLGTAPDSLPNLLPPPDFELGVVAGTRSLNWLGSAMVPGDDDGTVSLSRTQLPGMGDFVIVPASHSLIMHSQPAAEQVLHFLREGRFQHAQPDAADAAGPTPAPAGDIP